MRLALQNIAGEKHGAAAALLDRYAVPGTGADLRGFEWYLARHLSRSNEAASLDPLTGEVGAVAWSPDGKWIAAGAQNLRVWESVNGQAVLSHTSEAPVYALAFSPDSRRFAMSRAEGKVEVCDPASPETAASSVRLPVSPLAMAWHADGAGLEFFAGQMQWRWAQGTREAERIGPLGGVPRFPFLSGGGRRGMFVLRGPAGGDAWQMAVRDTERGLPLAGVRTPNDHMARCMACSDDGRWLLTGDYTGFLKWGGEPITLNVDPRGKQRTVFHDGIVFQATGAAGKEKLLAILEPGKEPVEWTLPGKLNACSPDGRWFAYTDTATSFLMLTDRSRARPPVQLGRGRLLSEPAFSADSRRCAIGDQNGWAHIYDTAIGTEIFGVAAHRGVVRGKAMSRDGTMLATAGFDGVAKLWDAATGQLRREFAGSTDTLWSVALSPDGGRLAAGTGESTVILWDTATGLETGTIALGGAPAPVEVLVFTPDGAALIAHGRVLQAPTVPARDP